MEEDQRQKIDELPDMVAPAGKFRLYLGAAAGVGKTVAMLDEGRRRNDRGTDVVIGLVESHGRPYTISKCEGLESIPKKLVNYRSTDFEEMDLDAVLLRKPELVLIDELAHTNVPGSSRHEKRWQDVMEILENGIHVLSTLNIQHLESIADVVESITKVKVRERVPDWVVRSADQIELVDSSPEQLRRRLIHGNVYPKEKVADALVNFFRTENLSALRDLALRFVADETEEEMLSYLARMGSTGTWETRERVMAAVTGAPGSESLLHRAARIASRSKGKLLVVHVKSSDAKRMSPDVAQKLESLAQDLGAEYHVIVADLVAGALVSFARSQRVTQIIMGATSHSRWKEFAHGSIVSKVIRAAGESGIDVHVIARQEDLGLLTEKEDYGSAGG